MAEPTTKTSRLLLRQVEKAHLYATGPGQLPWPHTLVVEFDNPEDGKPDGFIAQTKEGTNRLVITDSRAATTKRKGKKEDTKQEDA